MKLLEESTCKQQESLSGEEYIDEEVDAIELLGQISILYDDHIQNTQNTVLFNSNY